MNRVILYGWMLVSFSCAYDNAEELYGKEDCPPEGVSFTKNVHPIIQSNCAVSGCHINGQQSPTLESYAQITDHTDKIKEWTSDGIMPPSTSGRSLELDEIAAIACWVDSGALNN